VFFWLFVPKTLIASSFFDHCVIILTTILTFLKVLDPSILPLENSDAIPAKNRHKQKNVE